MRNIDKIKAMNIDEMAKYIANLQLNVMVLVQKNLVHCLPLPDKEEQEQIYKDTIKALESEGE